MTCDKRTTEVIDILRKLRKEERQHYGVPDYIKFPRSIYLWGKRVSKVLGQWWVITIEGVSVSVHVVESELWSSCSLSIVYTEHSRKCCLTEQKEGKTGEAGRMYDGGEPILLSTIIPNWLGEVGVRC